MSRARADARVTARVELAAVGRAYPAPPNAPSEGTRCSRRATASSSERASAITAELCGPRNDRGADRATIYHVPCGLRYDPPEYRGGVGVVESICTSRAISSSEAGRDTRTRARSRHTALASSTPAATHGHRPTHCPHRARATAVHVCTRSSLQRRQSPNHTPYHKTVSRQGAAGVGG